jgi:hypothetical protein
LLAELERIRDRAPPQDYSSDSSIEARRSFYARELHRLIPEHSFVVVILGCEGDKSILTFDPNMRNIVIELLVYDHAKAVDLQRRVKERVQQVIDRLFDDQKFVLMTGGSTLLAEDEPGLTSGEKEEIANFTYPANVILTPAGPSFGFFNSPAAEWPIGLEWALTQASMENEQFRLAILQDSAKAKPGTFVAPLRKEIDRWNSFPIGSKAQGLFYKRIPHAGRVDDLCLAGVIRDVDLHHGGRGAVPFMNGTSDLVGDLVGWFVFHTSNGSIVAREFGTPDQIK